jgi:hypothetical protein
MRNLLHLRGLALADEGTRVGRFEFLRYGLGNLGAGGLGERLEFGEGLIGRNFIARPELDSDEYRALDGF